MSEDVKCQTCEDKGKIQCPCCSGYGGAVNDFYPMGVGKAYNCFYCSGVGKIICPGCNKSRAIFWEQSTFTGVMGELLSWIRTWLFPEKNIS